MQQLLPDKGVNSGWADIRADNTNEFICFIESGYYDVISPMISDGEKAITFGEVTDALEEYLKQNNND